MVINVLSGSRNRRNSTQALSGVGYPTIWAYALFTVGTKMTVRQPEDVVARRHSGHQVSTATIFALVVAVLRWQHHRLSTLAVMVAMSDTSGGMFLALTSMMGNKEDSGT
jgi:2-keto-3-deoxygluconate permease